MSKRPSQEAWAEARTRWEADPKENFETIGQAMGVSRVAVSKRAAKEGWERVKTLRQIVQKAQLQADKVSAKVSEVSGAPLKSAAELAVDVRSDVLERHRADWAEHRKFFGLDEIKEDFDNGKKAKISAEMLLIRQKGERAAYGLDEESKGGETGFESLVADL